MNGNSVVLTETRVVGAIIQPLQPEKLVQIKTEEKVTIIKQDVVKKTDTKSPQKNFTMALPELPVHSNNLERCKFI